MAIAHAASGSGYYVGALGGNMTADTSTTFTFTYKPVTAGNAVLIWVCVAPNGVSPTTCSLAASGWTFTQVGGIVNGGGNSGVGAMFAAYAPNTSTATITVTWNRAWAGFANDLVDEFSGVNSSTIVDASNSAVGSGTPTVSVTPASNNTMVWVTCDGAITGVGTIGGMTATEGANDTEGDFTEYRLLTGGGGVAQTCTYTGSGYYTLGAVALKPAISSHLLALLGCGS